MPKVNDPRIVGLIRRSSGIPASELSDEKLMEAYSDSILMAGARLGVAFQDAKVTAKNLELALRRIAYGKKENSNG